MKKVKGVENLISVIIPIYNAEKYLKKCLDSIIESSYQDIEIICVNDGSIDSSINILMEYKSKDSRIRVINQENAGVSSARNAGLKEAIGEYIVFCDADDWVSPEMFGHLLNTRLDSDMVVCNVYNVKDGAYTIQKHAYGSATINNREDVRNKIIQSLLTPNDAFATLLQGVWNKLYRSSIIKKQNLHFEESISYAEDWLFNIAYFRNADTVCFIEEALYYHRIGLNMSLSSTVSYKEFENSIRIQDILYEWFPEKEQEKSENFRIIELQKECLIKYARLAGVRGFWGFCKTIYDNERLEQAYIAVESLPLIFRLPKLCVRCTTKLGLIGYMTWGFLIVLSTLLKRIPKRVFHLMAVGVNR